MSQKCQKYSSSTLTKEEEGESVFFFSLKREGVSKRFKKYSSSILTKEEEENIVFIFFSE